MTNWLQTRRTRSVFTGPNLGRLEKWKLLARKLKTFNRGWKSFTATHPTKHLPRPFSASLTGGAVLPHGVPSLPVGIRQVIGPGFQCGKEGHFRRSCPLLRAIIYGYVRGSQVGRMFILLRALYIAVVMHILGTVFCRIWQLLLNCCV